MELAGSLLLGLFAGRWLDQRYEAGSTFTLLGIGLGLAAGGRVLWKALQRANREAEQMEREERQARRAYHDDKIQDHSRNDPPDDSNH